MYSYDQVLTDVRQVYEQLTGLPAPKIDVRNPTYPLPPEGNPVALVQTEINYLNLFHIKSGISLRLSKAGPLPGASDVVPDPDRAGVGAIASIARYCVERSDRAVWGESGQRSST